jgi:hypothetical protein
LACEARANGAADPSIEIVTEIRAPSRPDEVADGGFVFRPAASAARFTTR